MKGSEAFLAKGARRPLKRLAMKQEAGWRNQTASLRDPLRGCHGFVDGDGRGCLIIRTPRYDAER